MPKRRGNKQENKLQQEEGRRERGDKTPKETEPECERDKHKHRRGSVWTSGGTEQMHILPEVIEYL